MSEIAGEAIAKESKSFLSLSLQETARRRTRAAEGLLAAAERDGLLVRGDEEEAKLPVILENQVDLSSS